MGGGYFQFFTKNRSQNHQKGAILHTLQANGMGSSPPAPPGYATGGSPGPLGPFSGYAYAPWRRA